jgi:hypothetical protein
VKKSGVVACSIGGGLRAFVKTLRHFTRFDRIFCEDQQKKMEMMF